jgi:hypothetical protein
MSDEKNTYEVLPCNLECLEEKIEKLNRRAKRLGCEQIVLTEERREIRTAKKIVPFHIKPIEYTYEIIIMSVTGPTPKLAGWTLVAKIEMLGEERLIKCVPGEECPEEYRKGDFHCDHCKTDRRRSNVFVMRHDDGRHVQIGRTCIQDFLGGVDPEMLLAIASMNFDVVKHIGEMDEEGFEFGRGSGYDSENSVIYLTAVSICIRHLGWVSRSAAGEGMATADDAWSLLNPPNSGEALARYEKWVEKNDLHFQERDKENAKAALEWAASHPTEGVSDYLYNLGVAARAGYVTRSSRGILASAVMVYLREMDRAEEAKQREKEDKTKSNEYLGEIKKREVFGPLTLVYENWFEGRFGVTTLLKFEDEAGNVLCWFASGHKDEFEKGDVVTLKATVKKHEEYKGRKQTIINRAVVVPAA